MSINVVGNQIASQNGYLGEDYAAAKYHLDINPRADIDCQDPLAEVKCCQAVIQDWSRPPFTRKGRFNLRKDQHDILMEKDGFYVFVLLQNGVVCDDRILYPDELENILGTPIEKDRTIRYDLLFPEVTG